MEKITDEMIHEINELARKSKTVGLSEKEKKRQQNYARNICVCLEKVFNNNFKMLKLSILKDMMSHLLYVKKQRNVRICQNLFDIHMFLCIMLVCYKEEK